MSARGEVDFSIMQALGDSVWLLNSWLYTGLDLWEMHQLRKAVKILGLDQPHLVHLILSHFCE